MLIKSITWTKEGNGNTAGKHFSYKYRTVIQFQYTFKKFEKQCIRNANVYNMFKDKYNAIGPGSS